MFARVYISPLIRIISALLLLLCVSSLVTSFPPVTHAFANSLNAVTTFKADVARSGHYGHETILGTSDVNPTQFGRRIAYPVDGQIYAQPLYLPNLVLNGTSHNVVYVATEHDTVYAFDADQTSPQPALWQTSLLPAGATAVPYADVSCTDMTPEIGVTGTPVIDAVSQTLYIVAYTKEDGHLFYRLHALDIMTGAEKVGSPLIIQGSVSGDGTGSVDHLISFDPSHQRQRSALLLSHGQLYIAFGSFCDNDPYHGWIFSYSYAGTSFQQEHIFNSSPDGMRAGIWGAGNALSADDGGNIYFMTGNGDFNLDAGGNNAGNSFVKLNSSLQLQDYFAPFNAQCLNAIDADLGSGSALVLPDLHESIGVGKEGRIYVFDNNHLGGYTSDTALTSCTSAELQRIDVDQVRQELPPGTVGGVYGNPAYWQASDSAYVYIAGAGSRTMAFQFSHGLLSSSPTSQTPERFAFAGGNPVISSDGVTNSSGLLWLIDPAGILRVYNARDLSQELYNSAQNSARDALGGYVKFATPVVANGQVFVGTQDALAIYGLLLPTSITEPLPFVTPTIVPGSAYNNIGISDDHQPALAAFDPTGRSYSTQAFQTAGLNPGDNTFYHHTVFTWPNVVAGTPDNYVADGQTIPLTPLDDDVSTVAFLGASVGGATSGRATIHYSDGSTQDFTLGFSDWLLDAGQSMPSFGNAIMLDLPYHNTPAGQEVGHTYLFYAEVSLDFHAPAKTVSAVTLPSASQGGQIHIFALTTR